MHETIVDFHDTKKRYQTFERAVAEDVCGRSASVQRDIEFIRQHKAVASEFMDRLESGDLSLRVTHNDTKLCCLINSISRCTLAERPQTSSATARSNV